MTSRVLTCGVDAYCSAGFLTEPDRGSSQGSNHAPPAQAFEGWDLVDLILSTVAEHENASKYVKISALLLYGLRRTGKTFGMPWALAEAIRRLTGSTARCQYMVVGNFSRRHWWISAGHK
jgi:hypothetical protein